MLKFQKAYRGIGYLDEPIITNSIQRANQNAPLKKINVEFDRNPKGSGVSTDHPATPCPALMMKRLWRILSKTKYHK